MTGQTDEALVLMERALASRDPLELALAGFLSAYNGRTLDKQRRPIKHHVDWCLRNDLPPLEAKRPHIELFVRWCESRPWSESYICQHFIGVRSFYKTCVRDDVLLRNPAEFVAAPPVHEEGQKRTFLTPLEFAAFLEASRNAGPVEHAAAVLMVSRIATIAGCRHITPHGLRRTVCTAWLVSGVPMRDMQSPCATPTRAPPACTTWPRTTRTATPATASPRSSPA